MYIESVRNRNSPPAVLLRESFREDGKVKKRTLRNLSDWVPERIEALRAALRASARGAQPTSSSTSTASLEDRFEIVRSLPHGHVAATLGTLRRLGIHTLLSRSPSRSRDIVCALIAARILDPDSKLAIARGLHESTASTSLGEVLGLTHIDADDIYTAMDWVFPQQLRIENQLAHRHLKDGTLLLYDLTSTWFEGHTCPLGKRGHSRDGKRDKLQIVIGLLCEREGRPIAVEVFDGNTGDPSTVAGQVAKIRKRFGLKRVVFVGDRGTITEARIREDLAPVEGLAWITALRAPAIRLLVDAGTLQLSLFDQQDLAEFTDPERPGERLVACLNPLLREERARNRRELLAATEKELEKIVIATKRTRRPLRGREKIGLRVGRVVGRRNMKKHFDLEISETAFRFSRREERIAEEGALDGIYIVRTPVPAAELSTSEVVLAYKGLSVVERAFRSHKTVDLKVRPIYHHLADRVRCHVFLCTLAYYIEWHMRQALAPLLFDDDDREGARVRRSSVVASAERSPSAERKAITKQTADGMPVHSFQTLLEDLATITRNTIRPCIPDSPTFEKTTLPTPLQQRALDLLQVSLRL